jgi:hypothetical protein
MSLVTEVVFVTPRREASERFAALFFEFKHGRRDEQYPVRPIEANGGGKVSGTYVYHLAVNYLNWEFIPAVEREAWPAGTVLYYHWYDEREPTVVTW